MIAFFIIFALAFARATPTQKRESLHGGGCLEYTVDQCDFGLPDSITNNAPFEFCSLVCSTQSDCKFFHYDYKKSQCDHYYTQQNEDFKSYCAELAGPKGKDGSLPINQCTNIPSDPCKGIKRSGCHYNGKVINTYPDVPEESLCQKYCQLLPDCLSYNFGKSSSECQLRTSNDETCDQVIVEKWVTKEDVDNCLNGHHHSSTPSISTTTVTTATTTTPTTTNATTTTPTLLTTLTTTTTTSTAITTTNQTTTTITTPTTTYTTITPEPLCTSSQLAIEETFALENATGSGEQWSFKNNRTIAIIQYNNDTELPVVGLGKESMLGINYNGTFWSNSFDDDVLGFVFGFVDPTEFFVFYVTKYNTSDNYWTTNFRITKVNSNTGLNGPDMWNAIFALSSVENQTEVIWRDNQPRGWLTYRKYHWHLKYRPLHGQLRLQIDWTYLGQSGILLDTGIVTNVHQSKPGRVGVFTYSQPSSLWQDMFYECDNDPLTF